jgi:hypothetical protein
MHRRLTVDGSYAARPEVLVQARRTVGARDDDEDDVVHWYDYEVNLDGARPLAYMDIMGGCPKKIRCSTVPLRRRAGVDRLSVLLD